VICAWCGERKGEKPPYNDDSISHSICKKCEQAALKELEDEDQNENHKNYGS